MNIEIVTTPNDSLKETGFGSRVACNNIMLSLLNSNHNVMITSCISKKELDAVVKRKPDLIIAIVKYIVLENGKQLWLSEYLDGEEANYTGSGMRALSYDSNKVLAKEQIALEGIDTAEFFITTPDEYKNVELLPLPFPLFIKPTDAANGNGIDIDSLVHDFEEYTEKVKSLHAIYNQPILVEEYLDGREFTVAVIEDGEKLIVSAVEIIPPEEGGLRILGAKVKTGNTEILQVIAEPDILLKVTDIAEKSFRALGVRDFGRIDIKMDSHGVCHFIEANLVPGMKKGSSYFPQACEISNGLDYDNVVRLMTQSGMERVH